MKLRSIGHLRLLLPVFILGMTVGSILSVLAISIYTRYYFSVEPHSYFSLRINQQPGLHTQYPNGSNYETADNQQHDHEIEHSPNLQNNIQILCWIMTRPASFTKAKHVKSTWGKRCNILLFMSSSKDESLPTVVLPIDEEDRAHLWQKTKLAFEYVHKNYRDQADWFVKADDDTYMIVENLRYMLAPYNTSRPIYFGHKFKKFVKQGYMSGGSGYVLSKEALDRFANRSPSVCRRDSGGSEDVEMGKCLQTLGVEAGDSRDDQGAERFLPLNPAFFLASKEDPKFWFWSYTFYAQRKGSKAISDSFVSLHYIDPPLMHVLDFMLYHAGPYGLIPWYQTKRMISADRIAPLPAKA